ncbi:MAG: hypothetical protein AUI16_01025 [Alphaproteobacteria bacterium 13_2_20CM_2_64_7]|jgi:hypothetical protein|nr:MAG: hypothetical protein AUI16_01025 [Alphaproteobacteria bacterium 13_2_20CM_2_64_7]
MYLIHFFDQSNYEFVMSLHSTREAAEAAIADLLQRFKIDHTASGPDCRGEIISLEPLPPKARWYELFDDCGEGVHLYLVECDGGAAEQISLDSGEDLAAA